MPQPRILVYPHFKFDAGGPVTVLATFISDDPFRDGAESVVNREIVFPQPDPWHSDEDVLDAIGKLHPKALVDWHRPEPAQPDA